MTMWASRDTENTGTVDLWGEKPKRYEYMDNDAKPQVQYDWSRDKEAKHANNPMYAWDRSAALSLEEFVNILGIDLLPGECVEIAVKRV